MVHCFGGGGRSHLGILALGIMQLWKYIEWHNKRAAYDSTACIVLIHFFKSSLPI